MNQSVNRYGWHNHRVMHKCFAESSTCSSARLTEVALFKVNLQFLKVPFPVYWTWTAPPYDQVKPSYTCTEKHESMDAFIQPHHILSFIQKNDSSTVIHHKNSCNALSKPFGNYVWQNMNCIQLFNAKANNKPHNYLPSVCVHITRQGQQQQARQR